MSWPSDVVALRRNSKTIGAAYTVLLDDFTIRVDASAGNVAVNLPPAASCFGQLVIVKKIDASGNSAIIDPNGNELIDGGASVAIGTQNETKIIQSNGVSWDVLF